MSNGDTEVRILRSAPHNNDRLRYFGYVHDEVCFKEKTDAGYGDFQKQL